jgi:hypothetical protein
VDVTLVAPSVWQKMHRGAGHGMFAFTAWIAYKRHSGSPQRNFPRETATISSSSDSICLISAHDGPFRFTTFDRWHRDVRRLVVRLEEDEELANADASDPIGR